MNLKLFTPQGHKQTLVFVPNVPLDFTEEEMSASIIASVPVKKVERIKKKGQDGQLVDTKNVKVTVHGREAPRTVKLYGVNFRADLYIFPVKQCALCWKFGHTKTRCTGTAQCSECGKAHDQDSDCDSPPRCINCQQSHPATDRNCPERGRRSKILKKMLLDRVPYAEAEKAFPRLQNQFSLLDDESDFPGLCESDTVRPVNTGAIPKGATRGRRCGRSGESWRNTQDGIRSNEAGLDEGWQHSSKQDQGNQARFYGAAGERTPEECGRGENIHKATEFEKFMAQLRKDIMRFCHGRNWLSPIIELKRKLESRINLERTEVETDHLLIEVSMELEKIIEDGTTHNTERQNSAIGPQNGL